MQRWITSNPSLDHIYNSIIGALIFAIKYKFRSQFLYSINARNTILNIRFKKRKKRKNLLKIDIGKYCIFLVLGYISQNTGCKSTYPTRIQALTEISGRTMEIDTCFIERCGKIKEKKRWRFETIDGNARLLKTVGTKNKTLERKKKRREASGKMKGRNKEYTRKKRNREMSKDKHDFR